MSDMIRIAVIGTEAEAGPLLASADRLTGIGCARLSDTLELEHFDAVAYCASSGGDMRLVCDVAQSGKHLLIDLAALTGVCETDAVIAACDAAKVQLMIAQPHRYLPSIRAVRESLDAGQLAKPGLLRIHRWVTRQSEDLGPLLLREVDLANDLFDRPPETVYAVAGDCGHSPQHPHSPQILQVHLGFSDGAMALIDITNSLPEGDDYYSLSLIGADGSAYADDHHNMQLSYRGGPAVAEPTRETPLHWTEPLRQFVSAIARKQERAVGVDSALSALRVTEAVGRAIDARTAMHRQGDRYGRE